ncbi:MAG: DNA-3-methyladenine glycosylase [Actinomycetota bacterium]|nr:MAG: DNA-3-methyladenine glycosylase [Actinomycetota bacterium]
MTIANRDKGLIITEAEAYGGSDDAASHAFAGMSRRNRSMFEDGGTLYVYLSYGIHRCINIVTGDQGDGQAVLIRSGIAVSGQPENINPMESTGKLVEGPGRVGRLLDAQLSDDGLDLLSSMSWKLLDTREILAAEQIPISRSARIGISKACEAQWRFEINFLSLNGRG